MGLSRDGVLLVLLTGISDHSCTKYLEDVATQYEHGPSPIPYFFASWIWRKTMIVGNNRLSENCVPMFFLNGLFEHVPYWL